jgi:hypothetical protein
MKHILKQHLQYSSFTWFSTWDFTLFWHRITHTSKDSSLWGSFTKDYNVYTMEFTMISTFYFLKISHSYTIFLQVFIQLTTLSYQMQIMSQKLQSLPFIYLKERSGWIVNHVHLHLFFMYQTNHQVSLIIFHPPMDRFFWNNVEPIHRRMENKPSKFK